MVTNYSANLNIILLNYIINDENLKTPKIGLLTVFKKNYVFTTQF